MSAALLPAITAVTFNSDKAAIAHLQTAARGRRAHLETTASLASDIANSAVEDVTGPRPARHRKETQA